MHLLQVRTNPGAEHPKMAEQAPHNHAEMVTGSSQNHPKSPLRAKFESRAVVCRYCKGLFVPGKGRQSDYCCDSHLELGMQGLTEGDDYCAFCGEPLTPAQIRRGDAACKNCVSKGDVSDFFKSRGL